MNAPTNTQYRQLTVQKFAGAGGADVTGVDPLAGGAHMALKMREDVVTDGGYPEAILFNAPDRNGDFFAVPKVVE